MVILPCIHTQAFNKNPLSLLLNTQTHTHTQTHRHLSLSLFPHPLPPSLFRVACLARTPYLSQRRFSLNAGERNGRAAAAAGK